MVTNYVEMIRKYLPFMTKYTPFMTDFSQILCGKLSGCYNIYGLKKKKKGSNRKILSYRNKRQVHLESGLSLVSLVLCSNRVE